MQSAVSKRGLIGPPQETYKELCTEEGGVSIVDEGCADFFCGNGERTCWNFRRRGAELEMHAWREVKEARNGAQLCFCGGVFLSGCGCVLVSGFLLDADDDA